MTRLTRLSRALALYLFPRRTWRYRRDHKRGSLAVVQAARVAYHEQAGYGEGCFTPDAYDRLVGQLQRAPQMCRGGQCHIRPRGNYPEARFCRRHCPSCNGPLAPRCTQHSVISADELGERIAAGMSEYSSMADD